MATINRKWPAVDIMLLYTQGDTSGWNEMLTICLNKHDLLTLEKLYYGLQVGMDDVVKNKLDNEKIINMFIRWTKSIELTVKQIYREKRPNPLDDPHTAIAIKTRDILEYNKLKTEKTKRDVLLEQWLKRVRF